MNRELVRPTTKGHHYYGHVEDLQDVGNFWIWMLAIPLTILFIGILIAYPSILALVMLWWFLKR